MPASSSVLIGRSAEQAALGRLVDSLAHGLSAALVLRGDAGVGKTALLAQLPHIAPDVDFTWLSGVESETSLGFAGLHRLLIPHLHRMQEVPPVQRSALASALGLTEAKPTNVFLVGQAVLTMLADAAQARPLVCVIDDAQWLDQESVEVLAFVARRLFAEQLGVVFSVREPPRNQQFEGIAELSISGLETEEAAAMLATITSQRVDPKVAEHVAQMVAGNPMAVGEVGRQLADARLTPDLLLNGPLPLGRRLEEHFRTQVQDLPASCRAVLLLAATHTSTDTAVLRRAAALDGLDLEAAAPAQTNSLIERGADIRFRHPLIRAAVYAAASPAERRHAHKTLAAVIDKTTDRDQHAWHLAAATLLPNENVAAELEGCAVIARSRGGYSDEASFLARAAALSPDSSRAASRYLDSATAALNSGAPHRATELLNLATPHLREPFARVHAQLIHVDIIINSGLEPYTALTSKRLEAARALITSDSALARQTLLEAIRSGILCGSYSSDTTLEQLGRTALDLWPALDGAHSVDDFLLQGLATAITDRFTEAAPALRRAVGMLDQIVSGTELESSTRLMIFDTRVYLGHYAAICIFDDRRLIRLLRDAVDSQRERGILHSLVIGLHILAIHESVMGNISSAVAHKEEAHAVAKALGYTGQRMSATLPNAQLLAWQGRDHEVLEVTTSMFAFAGYLQVGELKRAARHALIVMHIGRGDYEQAFATGMQGLADNYTHLEVESLPSIIEAALRTGRQDVADDVLSKLRTIALASGTNWALGLLTRCSALAAAHKIEAEALYRESIAYLDETIVLTDQARAHLAYGEWLRRQQRYIEARTELRIAYDMFFSMGAPAFAERARVELAAAGAKIKKAKIGTLSTLTPQETQVVELAATGATNQEIATRLFLSTHTVAYHLTKAFRKLGVSSRRELIMANVPQHSIETV